MPQLPSKKDYDEIVKRLKAAQTALMPKVQELRDVADWQRWANVGIQEQLCEKMEALKTVEDPEAIARQVRELQEQWRQAADVPRAQGEALWRRFKTAHDEAWARCEAHFAAQAEARGENLAKKIALCERAEALADSTNWIQTADEIKKLQAEWKTIGAVSRGQEKAIWERFRGACDRFFTRRHADLAERKTVWAENLARKEALCAKAEALKDSTDWDAAARRDEAAAGRVEDDRAGEEEPVGGDVAAFPRRRAIISSRATRSATTSRSASASPRARRSVAELEALAPSRTSGRHRRQRRAQPPAAILAIGRQCATAARARGEAAELARARRRSRSRARARRALREGVRRASSSAGRRCSAARIWIPTPTARRWKRSSQRIEDAGHVDRRAGAGGGRRRAVADRAAGGDAEGSAGRQHDRRQEPTTTAVCAPRPKTCARRRRRCRGSGRCRIRCGGRSPIGSSVPRAASGRDGRHSATGRS